MKKRYFASLVSVLFAFSFIAFGQPASGNTYAPDPGEVVITCPNDTVVSCAPDSCGAWVDVMPATATGSEPIDSIWNNITGQSSAYAWYPVGSTVITWYALDILGEIDSCDMMVTVMDVIPPSMACNDTTIECPSDYFPPDSSTIPVWDNCDPDPLVTFMGETYVGLGIVPGWCPTSINRIYRATDDAGNYTTCTQVITMADNCDCQICQDTVPHFYVDLTGSCDQEFIIEDIARVGYCCDASWPDRCISFQVMISAASVGVFIEIIEGAVPGGWWWQTDCGDSTRWDETICIPPNEYHTITMCEAGNNPNTYVLRAVCGIIAPDSISTPIDSSREISVGGSVEESTITWESIYPGANGQYNGYLACTTGCASNIFTPDSLSPNEIWYLVCGDVADNPCSEAGQADVCDTVKVYVYPEAGIIIDPNLNKMDLSILPNPASDYSTVKFYLDNPTVATFYLSDQAGIERKVISLGRLDQGQHEFILDTKDLPSGIYYYKISTGNQFSAGKLAVMR